MEGTDLPPRPEEDDPRDNQIIQLVQELEETKLALGLLKARPAESEPASAGQATVPSDGQPWIGRNLSILFPVNKDVNPSIMYAHLALFDKATMRFEMQKDTDITRARNVLATRFLESGVEWSLWLDSDILPVIGNPGWFRHWSGSTKLPNETLAYNVVTRLMAHRKSLVGAVYAGRSAHSKLIIAPDLHPTKPADKALAAELRKKPAPQRLEPVAYLATGCMLVNRQVYVDILAKEPGLKVGKLIGFFDTGRGVGEDAAFCGRAKAVGHQAYLDCGCVVGHIGNYCYLPESLVD